MTQKCSVKKQTEEEIQEELNGFTALTELDALTTYLESLEKELRDLPTRIQRVRNAIKAKQDRLSKQEGAYVPMSTFVGHLESLTSIQPPGKRNPTEMLRDEYKGMKLGDIAAKVLSDKQSPMTTTELSRIIYNAESDDELGRARNSLSTELRAGAKARNPRWRKIGRYAYASL